MTKSITKRVIGMAATGLLGLTLAACGSDDSADNAADGEEVVNIGILQFMEHNSLNAAKDGFIAELEDAGYVEGDSVNFDVMNAQGDQSNLQSMSEQLSENNDLMLSIATPAAQSLATVEQEKPILFTAVTDAVDAGLVESNESPGANLTGTSDMVPIEEQIQLLLSIVPDAETVGIIYNSSEPNSEIQADMAIEELKALDVTAQVSTVTTTNDVQQVLTSLASDVDALYIPTDNTLASTADTVGEIAMEYQLPVVAGATDQVEAGGLATYGINYEALGRQTAQMALDILENEASPDNLAVEQSNDLELFINEDMADALGIDPDSISLSKE
ncbi:MAG: ABC transporter substrate-binding protein [Alkalibacterium sp.]|uniref:Putative ABC transport system substrate-binding protein n=1 Tax=Alkalibacterium gilvum TaxID=1130080 RepID=A0A1H6RS03_9LACT|nr:MULTISPECIES: ABC transporter substrate-binding protein [Alkalibacterium]MDN6294266.1 ABC transporter substrate-binding protein [Alkalibacterium sp.]MDN6295875.1 ABC transporter substrate-binding protein [Alkalibacterium sp.]MDN6326746.1 ABC transporter substrate-binding protein [Alkalibacterium sp.]MDN6398007.1 ABC transporter substrate-binding protein [Alkalibacterium sp.]SEI58509.1 putative ABC transport system substrate-binding protein [Alkalibacterium gilvum]